MISKANLASIGVFDSGVGGLSVLREIRRALPAEALCYVADSAHAPYGERSVGYIEARSRHIIGFLQDQGAKAVVVACNTVTGLVIEHLRAAFPELPLIAIEPAVKPAAAATRSGVVGVLAIKPSVFAADLIITAHRGVSGLASMDGSFRLVTNVSGAEQEIKVPQRLKIVQLKALMP